MIAGQEFQTQSADVVFLGGFLRRRGEIGETTALAVAGVSRRRSTAPLTSLARVFYHLKVTENRGREENGCLTADEPQRQPDEPSSAKRRQSG